uniref:Uncharacterized protein n=1 Tax=Utricularia reniformis TaxID=192314 RepID=A0A1Y0B4B0_9LAMI|nr:hypothetical protein AEK19_MT2068 [Utricularia reniformis]ART32224.1 hypothetical protein AEK19_MT2068 [Utricularia reniformis]
MNGGRTKEKVWLTIQKWNLLFQRCLYQILTTLVVRCTFFSLLYMAFHFYSSNSLPKLTGWELDKKKNNYDWGSTSSKATTTSWLTILKRTGYAQLSKVQKARD